MSIAGFVWECKCGYLENGEEAPEECPDCFKLDSFTKLPEELILEREKDMTEELDFISKRRITEKKNKPKIKEKKNESKKKKKSI